MIAQMVYGTDYVAEELARYHKALPGSRSEAKSNGLSSLVFRVNGQPNLESTKTLSQGREVILQEGL